MTLFQFQRVKICQINRWFRARASLWARVAHRYAIPAPKETKWQSLATQIDTSIFSYGIFVVISVICSKCSKMHGCAGTFFFYTVAPASDLTSQTYTSSFVPQLQEGDFWLVDYSSRNQPALSRWQSIYTHVTAVTFVSPRWQFGNQIMDLDSLSKTNGTAQYTIWRNHHFEGPRDTTTTTIGGIVCYFILSDTTCHRGDNLVTPVTCGNGDKW